MDTQWRTGKHLYPVHIWSNTIKILDSYPWTSYGTPVNTVWVENYNTKITYQIKTKTLRPGKISFGEECLGFFHREVGTHYLQSVFTMELFLEMVYLKTRMIIGIWYINGLLWYIMIQVRELSKCIGDHVEQPGLLHISRRRNHILHSGKTQNQISQAMNGTQWRNTHTNCSENHKTSDQRHGKVVSFFFTLRPFPRVPELPG